MQRVCGGLQVTHSLLLNSRFKINRHCRFVVMAVCGLLGQDEIGEKSLVSCGLG
jgi:hypothetical protein